MGVRNAWIKNGIGMYVACNYIGNYICAYAYIICSNTFLQTTYVHYMSYVHVYTDPVCLLSISVCPQHAGPPPLFGAGFPTRPLHANLYQATSYLVTGLEVCNGLPLTLRLLPVWLFSYTSYCNKCNLKTRFKSGLGRKRSWCVPCGAWWLNGRCYPSGGSQ